MIKRSGGVKLFVFNLIFYFYGEVTSRPMIYVRKQLARITLLNEFAGIFFPKMKFQVFNALWLFICIFCGTVYFASKVNILRFSGWLSSISKMKMNSCFLGFLGWAKWMKTFDTWAINYCQNSPQIRLMMHLRNSDTKPQWTEWMNFETFCNAETYNSFVMCHSKNMSDIQLHFALAPSYRIFDFFQI